MSRPPGPSGREPRKGCAAPGPSKRERGLALPGEDRIYWMKRDAAASLSGRPMPSRGRGPMSTAGKVLTVLILLVMVVWIVMMSGVSQLNYNYAQKVDTQQ